MKRTVLWCIRGLAAAVILALLVPPPVRAHIDDNSGQSLQLFSYQMTGPEPVLDGDIATTDPDEWGEAYNRRIILTPDGDAASDSATMLIMNNDSCLFIALAYEWDNTGEENLIEFYFDEGAGGHSHDDVLSAGHENAVAYERDGVKRDLYWDGAAWAEDGDGVADFAAGWDWSATINNIEIRIPLNSLKNDDGTNSDLDVDADDEIGFLFRIFKMGKGFSNYVSWTQFPDTDVGAAGNYADLKLGVDKKYITFYATHAAIGTPAVTDGDILGDDGWRGSYRRDLVMTNFAGDIRGASLYLVEDAANDDIFMGLRMEDALYNAGDYIRVYAEQEAGLAGDMADAKLNDNAENCLQLTAAGVFADLYFKDAATNSDLGTWEVDGDADRQTGAVTYDAAADRYNFELLMIKDGGTRDLDLNDDAWCQLLVEYYDADMPVGERYYYWRVSTDNVQVLADQSVTPPNRIAIGWSRLQLGAPFIQMVYPEDGATVAGDVNIRIYAQDENADGITAVEFCRISDTNTVYGLTRIAGLDEWSGTWNTTALGNGGDTLVIKVEDDEGNIAVRLVELTVNNAAGSVSPPTVAVTSPAAGSRVNGVVAVGFSATGGAAISTIEINIDGGGYAATSTDSSHSWNTSGLAQGAHSIRIKAVDANGSAGYSEVTSYIVNNDPAVVLVTPAAGSVVGGNVAVAFSVAAVAPAVVESTFISVDGGAFVPTDTDSSHILATSGWGDAGHTVQIRVTDDSGRSGVSQMVSIVSVNAPSVNITAPAADAVLAGPVTVAFSAVSVAPAVIGSTLISIDGGIFMPTATGSTHVWDSSPAVDGAHTVQLKAKDDNGKTGVSALVKVNTVNSPAVVIIAPAADAVLTGPVTVSFTAIAAGMAVIESTLISVDGSAFMPIITGSTHVWDTDPVVDGAHTLVLKVKDDNGKTGVSELLKVNTVNSPSVGILAPAPDAVVSDTVTVAFSTVPVGAAVVESTLISIDGSAFVPTSTGSSHIWASGPAVDGAHTVLLKVKDDNGKTGISYLLKVNTVNSPEIGITAPVADAELRGTVVVSFAAVPISSALITVTEISVNGATWRATSTGATDTLDTQPLSEGVQLLQVRATDSNGKQAFSPLVKFRVRNAPAVVVTAPGAGEIISGTAEVAFTAVPVTPAALDSVLISIDGGAWLATDSDTGHTLITVDLVDGTHSVRIKAVDTNGKAAMTDPVLFISRNNPSIIFTAPMAGEALNGTVTVTFTALSIAPATTGSVQVSLDGGPFAAATTESTFIWNTAMVRDGEHILALRVTDDRGKTGESDVRLVTTDNTAPVITAATVDYGTAAAVMDSGSVTITSLILDMGTGVDRTALYLSVPALGLDSVPLIDAGIVGDDRYGVSVIPAGLTSGSIAYMLSAADGLGNSGVIVDSFYYDGTPPQLNVTVTPLAEDGADGLHGNSYFPRVLLKGTYGDLHSGVERAWIRVTPDSGGTGDGINSPLALDPVETSFCRPVELAEGVNSITVSVRDKAGNLVSTDLALTYIPPKVTGVIGAAGGNLVNPNGTRLMVPENALAAGMTISITRLGTGALPAPLDNGLKLLESAYDFGPDGTIFRKPVMVTLAYSPAELDLDGDGAADLDEAGLTVYFLDGTRWLPAGEPVVDTAENTVSVSVNHFTVYAVGSALSGPDAVNHYWTRNPVSRSQQSTFVYTLASEATVSLHIMDMAGDLVRTIICNELKAAGTHSVKWNGNNARDVFAGTGLYVYLYSVEDVSGTTVVRKPVAILDK